jgi:hypothetical protein
MRLSKRSLPILEPLKDAVSLCDGLAADWQKCIETLRQVAEGVDAEALADARAFET